MKTYQITHIEPNSELKLPEKNQSAPKSSIFYFLFVLLVATYFIHGLAYPGNYDLVKSYTKYSEVKK